MTRAEQEKGHARSLLNEICNLENNALQLEMQLNFQAESSESQSIWQSMKQLNQQISLLETQIRSEEDRQHGLLNKKKASKSTDATFAPRTF